MNKPCTYYFEKISDWYLGKLSGKIVVVTSARVYNGSALVNELVKYSFKVIRVSREGFTPLANIQTIKAFLCAGGSLQLGGQCFNK